MYEVRGLLENTCCFFGHRTINESEELKKELAEIIERLIVEYSVDTFLFGSKSRFNSLCLELVSKIKKKHPHIKRVYVRAEFPFISDGYKEYLLERVASVLSANAGKTPVLIYKEEKKQTSMAPPHLWADATESLLGELKDILGDGNVVLK